MELMVNKSSPMGGFSGANPLSPTYFWRVPKENKGNLDVDKWNLW